MLPKTCKESSFLLFLSTQEELNAFGELTSKNDLVAQVLGTMLAPISSLAFVLDQIRLQKEAPEAAAAAE